MWTEAEIRRALDDACLSSRHTDLVISRLPRRWPERPDYVPGSDMGNWARDWDRYFRKLADMLEQRDG